MRAEPIVNCQDSDRNQTAGHQNVTQKKDDCDACDGCAEESKTNPIEPRRPVFARWERWHDIGFGFAHQLVYGHEGKSAGGSPFNDEGQGEHGSFAVAAAIVHEHNVAAGLISGLARWEM